MRYLITGAAGFIGSKVGHDLLRDGHEVFCLDSLSDYYSVSLKEARYNSLVEIPLLKDNLQNRSSLYEIVKRIMPDTVIHLGAQAGVRLTLNDNTRYVNSNLVAFSNILTVVIENEIPNFLYASSSSIYGDSAKIPYVESEKLLIPNSFYGGTKLSNEILSRSIIPNSKTKARGLRFFTVYGPWGRPDMVYFRIIANSLTGNKLQINGDGTIQRDFTYIDDASKSVLLLAKQLSQEENGFNDVVNVGGGSPCSIQELISLTENLAGQKITFERSDRNPGDVEKTMADPSYLRSLINFTPMTTLGEGIGKTLNWAKAPGIEENLAAWIDSVI